MSIVVSSRNRAVLLPRLFAAFEAQTHRDFDVTVVDDGSTDETPEVLAHLAAAASFPTDIIRGGGLGPAVGRELGWRRARGATIAFTDDDCVPDPRWLEAGTARLGTRSAIVVGQTRPNPDQAANRGPFSRTLTVKDTRFFQTCNIFYRREDLEAVGGFDPAFDKPGGEDTDLALRIVGELGAEALFEEAALVHHDIRPSNLRMSLREARRWTGVPRLFAKHPQIRRSYLHMGIFWRRSHPRVMVAWLGLAGAFVHPLALVLVGPWLWFRVIRKPLTRSRRRLPGTLPGAFLIDSTEVITMIRASIRERTFVL